MPKVYIIRALVIWAALVIPSLCSATDDPIDLEMAPLFEKVKAPIAAEREAAVRELLALREAVSDELKNIVNDAGQGKVGHGTKASVLSLMGRMKLAQCADVLERERAWRWDWDADPEMERPRSIRVRTLRLLNLQRPNIFERTYQAARCKDNMTLVADRPKGSLAAYPALARSLSGLRERNWKTRFDYEDAVVRWYEVVSRSMDSVLKPPRPGSPDVYSNEVKATAAYVLGEYRIPRPFARIKNIDLRDEKGVCDRYAQTLTVAVGEPDRPCVVSLVKSGFLGTIHSCLDEIAGHGELAQETRDRLARVILEIDPAKAREVLEAKVTEMEGDAPLAITREERLKRAQRLRSVEPILRGNP